MSMAVRIEFLNVIIPIKEIKEKFHGGLARFVETLGNPLRSWSDGELYRLGAMSPLDIFLIVSQLESGGLQGIQTRNRKQTWIDFCVVDRCTGPTLPCAWIETDLEAGEVKLKEFRGGKRNRRREKTEEE